MPFGKRKIYTAIVYKIHQTAPTAYEAKSIDYILDETPIVNQKQLQHWQWISDYYLTSLGNVIRAGLPSMFLLQSETILKRNDAFADEIQLTEDEYLVFEALQNQSILKVDEVAKILNKKNVLPLLQTLMQKGVLQIKEEVFEQYKPKLVKFVKLIDKYANEDALHELLDTLNRAKKQKQAVLQYFILSNAKKPIKVKTLADSAKVSNAVLKALVYKGVFEFYHIQTDRILQGKKTNSLPELVPFQQEALENIETVLSQKDVCLLHGVTSSGKTEIYANYMAKILAKKQQVLFLLPEIALTTQLINRLKKYFGDQLAVFHSKYSLQERVEVYKNVLQNKDKAQIVIGARSAIFLPFTNLGLIIVDESHEQSYKQMDPAPRYQARDSAIVLAKLHQAKVVLGSATPSIESYYNVQQNKYGLVSITKRFGNVQMPEIELVNLQEKYKKKEMKGHFSDILLKQIEACLENKEQVILFQNKRGYSPVVHCNTCGTTPQCPNCDVSLTYHKYQNELRCHYCNYQRTMLKICDACGGTSISSKGFGTEQIEQELGVLFPKANIGRMDYDTTRGKHGYYRIIEAFQEQEMDILVGTQMLSKGLDFSNVTLVGVLNADNMLNFPDFRAHERSFQLLVQVAGRSGRAKKRGKVLIQTFNPYHQILQQVTTNDYQKMYKEQLYERKCYDYPPFVRTIKITLKHRDVYLVDKASKWLFSSLHNQFKDHVLGPTTPSVARIRNQFIKHILIKINPLHVKKAKQVLKKVHLSFDSIAQYRAVRVNIDVDNY